MSEEENQDVQMDEAEPEQQESREDKNNSAMSEKRPEVTLNTDITKQAGTAVIVGQIAAQGQGQQEEDDLLNNKDICGYDKDGKPIKTNVKCCGQLKTARQSFIIKVYITTAIMLAITASSVTAVTLIPGGQALAKQHNWLMYVGGICGIILMLIIIVGKKTSRKEPCNYILLVAFTLCWTLMVTMLTTFFKPQVIMIAAVTTAVMTFGLTGIASCISHEINWCYGLLGCIVSAIVPFIFFTLYLDSFFIENIICFLGTIVTSVYIVIDSQSIMKRLSLEEFVIGALMLYCDIIQLFLFLLSLMGKK